MSASQPAPDPRVAVIENHYEADILAYFGPVARGWDDYLIDACRARQKRKNVLLLLTTLGGDPHAAYRMARCLRQTYNTQNGGQVIIFVSSVCASAGTLITLAADRLILSDHAELGPLDMQMRKPDEVGERTSGLTPIQALNFLEGETKKFFRSQFEGLRFSRGFSTKMAADISAQLAGSMLSNLYEQIDPLRLAEYDRAMRIAAEYGERIKTSNVRPHAIKQLLEAYPSHEFCIDPAEALQLFHSIESPLLELDTWSIEVKNYADKFLDAADPAVFFVNDSVSTQPSSPNENRNHPVPTESSDASGAPKQAGNGATAPNSKGRAKPPVQQTSR